MAERTGRARAAGLLLGVLLGAAVPAVAGPMETPGFAQALSCSACHGQDGAGSGDAVPILAGRPAWYFKKAVADYASGRRLSSEMEPFAKMIATLGVDDLAAYFASRPRAVSAARVDRLAVVNGRRAASVCVACHGPDGRGDAARGIPDLTGQPAGFLLNQMRLFKAERRSPGDAALTQGKAVLKSLDDATLADVAAYYSSLGR